MKNNIIFIAALLLLAPFAAAAADLDYRYLQLSLVATETDVAGVDIDGDVLELSGSFPLAKQWALVFETTDESYEFDVDGETRQLGLEFHAPFSDKGDFTVGFNLIDFELSAPGGSSIDDSGNFIAVGFRRRVNPGLEIAAEYFLIDIDESTTGFEIDLLFAAGASLQLIAGISSSEDTNRVGIGIRSSF